MYMGRVISSPETEILRELQGARVLITGLSRDMGVDIARAFADLNARLIVQSNDLSPEVTELFAHLSQGAKELRLYTTPLATAEHATTLAQTASQAFGGLDAVINLADFSDADVARASEGGRVEDVVTERLTPLAHLTRVVANRMRLVFSEGLILNVVRMRRPVSKRESAIATVLHGALAAMTSSEARGWAAHGIRVNSIGPGSSLVTEPNAAGRVANEPDIAALALYLASRRGQSMSGHVFEAV